jgi:uracil phosphoribosyltransferase
MPLVLICKASKLPLLTVSVIKPLLHFLSLAFNNSKKKQIKIKQDVVLKGMLIIIVDNMLSTREMLCVVLQLLNKASISAKDVSIIVVAKFLVYCS